MVTNDWRAAWRTAAMQAIGEVLGAFGKPHGPDNLTDTDRAFLAGLYDGKWPTGNQTFDRVAVAMARAFGLLGRDAEPSTLGVDELLHVIADTASREGLVVLVPMTHAIGAELEQLRRVALAGRNYLVAKDADSEALGGADGAKAIETGQAAYLAWMKFQESLHAIGLGLGAKPITKGTDQ